LDDVGKDTYHHTFFEMLGNWSFGDYFKKDAIAWAWELLTEVWKLDKSRLHVTVFEGDEKNGIPRDDEAIQYWRDVAGVDPSHIHLGNKKDNFWEMGDTGPCGPCTEIHIDRTPDKSGAHLVNAGTPDVIEIWNNVFIQFNRNPDGSLTPLPAQHVDTGMGFERIAAVLQGKSSNYDTDVFLPIFKAIQSTTNAPNYTGKLDSLPDIAYRVIADHIRTLTFALTDGAVPSNEKRGYVLRSVLRRAARYAWQVFERKTPFLHLLVPVVVDHFGDAFPELKRDPKKVAGIIEDEEKSFLRTLDKGIKGFNKAAKTAREDGSNTISGKVAFDLHTEQGVFIDITRQMAEEANLRVDLTEYNRLLEEFKRISGEGRTKFVITAIQGDLPATDDSPKFGEASLPGVTVLGWVIGSTVTREGSLNTTEEVALLLDRTPFYAEQGGQVGDRGEIIVGNVRFLVRDTQRLGDSVLHIGSLLEGSLAVGSSATATVTGPRLHIERNHTTTHLLNLALRRVLGDHVEQKGSLVDGEKTRFDFSHDKPVTPDQMREIEAIVNEHIAANFPVSAHVVPLPEAKKLPGVRAVFGEKYPDPVRVVVIGTDSLDRTTAEMSIEFCGGTHLRSTGQIGLFKLISQEAVAKGIRRVIGVTAEKAMDAIQETQSIVEDLTGKLNCKPEELATRLTALQDEIKRLQTAAKKAAIAEVGNTIDRLIASATVINGSKLVIGELPAVPMDAVRSQIEGMRQKAGSAVIALAWADDGKASLLVALTEDLVAKGLSASELMKPIAATVGGGGGGKRPELAQAGGKDVSKIPDALATATQLATNALS
jgi:alanyl-tRNA synthetase